MAQNQRRKYSKPDESATKKLNVILSSHTSPLPPSASLVFPILPTLCRRGQLVGRPLLPRESVAVVVSLPGWKTEITNSPRIDHLDAALPRWTTEISKPNQFHLPRITTEDPASPYSPMSPCGFSDDEDEYHLPAFHHHAYSSPQKKREHVDKHQKRMKAAIENRNRIDEVAQQQMEEVFEKNEIYRNHRRIEAQDAPKRKKKTQLQSNWLIIVLACAPIHILRARTAILRSQETLRNFLYPIVWRVFKSKKLRREKEYRAREALSEMTRLTPEKLVKLTFFELWPHNALQKVVLSLSPKVFYKDEFIMREGDCGDVRMYFLDTGSVEVIIKKQNVKKRSRRDGMVVATLGPGAYFGEFALVSDEPRMASVQCQVECLCWSLTLQDFQQSLSGVSENSPLRASLKEIADKRRGQNITKLYPLKPQQIRALPLFSLFSDENIKKLLASLTPFVTHTGDLVIKEGEKGSCLYFIARGTVEVWRKRGFCEPGSKEDEWSPDEGKRHWNPELGIRQAILGTGEMFGDISSIFLEHRSATVKCEANCDLFKLEKSTLMEFLLQDVVMFLKVKDLTNIRRAKWIPRVSSQHIGRCPYLIERYGNHAIKMAGTVKELLVPKVVAESDVIVEIGEFQRNYFHHVW